MKKVVYIVFTYSPCSTNKYDYYGVFTSKKAARAEAAKHFAADFFEIELNKPTQF